MALLLLMHSAIGNRLLMWSAGRGDDKLLRVVLLLGASVNAKDKNGGTVLFYAAGEGHTSTVKLLVAAGADATVVDKRDNTALCYALRTRQPNTELMQILIEQGALKVQSQHGSPLMCIEFSTSSEAYIEILLKNGVEADTANASGYTPLLKFAYDGNSNAVTTLLRHGARVNAVTVDGKTAISEAVIQGNDDIVELLLNAGADRNVRIGGQNLVDIATDQLKSYQGANPFMTRKYNRIVELLEGGR